MKNKLLMLAVAGLFLPGCVSSQEIARVEASQRAPSTALRSAIVSAARDQLVDPYSIRDAEISSVVDASPDKKVQAVCVKFNSKNRMGGYVGRSAWSVRVVNDKPVGVRQDAPGCYLEGMKYHPFPELENLKNL